MRRILIAVGSATLLLLAVACGGGGGAAPAAPRPATTSPSQAAAPPATQPPAGRGYQETTVTNGATITGVVSFRGTAPVAEPLKVDKDTQVCGTVKESEKLIVSANGGIRNAVVSIKKVTTGKAIAFPATVTVDQKDCLYTPRVLIGRVSGSLEVRNSDPLMHNVHSFPFDNPSINRAQPQGSAPIRAALELPEIIQIGCDIHGWMSAWLVVAEHPYYVITGTDGSFRLSDVPPGTYTLEVWHETLGTSTEEVTVKAGESAEASFSLAR